MFKKIENLPINFERQPADLNFKIIRLNKN